jgi:predicted ester cyclase
MGTSDNEEIVRRAYLKGMNNRDMSIIRECFSPTYVCHFPAGQGYVQGIDPFVETLDAFLGAFDHLTFSVEESLACGGDRVVLRWSAVGRHTGDYAGIAKTQVVPATGRTISMSATDVYRIEDGRIAEEWNTFDGYYVLAQMGALVPAAS